MIKPAIMVSDKLQVLFEDNHLLVVNKPGGLLVQGDATGDKTLLDIGKAYIKQKYDKPGKVFLGTVHRIDRPVSGIVVMARTSKALERLNKQFRDRKIYKKYWAVVKRKPKKEKDKLVNWLIKNTDKNVVTSYTREVEGSQRAELHYKVLGKLNDHFLLEVNPITGRPHQIRVQLSAMGCPIRGDLKYGFHKPNNDANINLHAREIVFEHPVKKEQIKLTAPLPENDFWEQFLVLDRVKIKDKDIGRIV
jgi:23S rRNA pseudouridine1911/1915/1917 synthase